MSEVSEGQIQTASLDHLGLVAAICQDLKVAQRIDNRLPCDSQIDTTSILVHGAYEVTEDPKTVAVVHGFSKDHRPDLKQIVLSLVVNGPSSIPLWMESLDGNSSDKASFHETIKNVENFRAQIDLKGKFKWIADSALYTKDKLLKSNDYLWVTRVPESIKEAKNLVEKLDEEIAWVEGGEGYKTSEYKSFYGGIKQRWLLVFSEETYKREKSTLEKKLKREEEELKQVLCHFGKKKFHCEQDARKALEEVKKLDFVQF